MEPQTPQLDPDAVNLAKAIRQVETGGKADAKGKSGEWGAYQFMPETWNNLNKKYGTNYQFGKATIQQQNELAYKQIKEWKDQGIRADSIASLWNSGKPEWKGNVGVNKAGVKYDVPKYVNSVGKAYKTIKGGGEVQVDPKNPSSLTGQQMAEPTEKPKGTFQKIFESMTASEKGLGETIGRALLGGDKFQEKLVGQYEDNAKKLLELSAKQSDPELKKKYYDMAQGMYDEGKAAGEEFKGKSFKQIAGEVAGVALDVGLTVSGLGAGKAVQAAKAAKAAKEVSTAAKIGKTAASMAKIGAGYGAAEALREDKSLPEIAKSATVGGVAGGLLGAAGSAATRLFTEYLPYRLARTYLPGTSKKEVQYAMEKGLGTPAKMLKESEASIKELGSQLGKELINPKYAKVKVGAKDLLPQVIEQFPHAGLDSKEIARKLMQVAPNKKALIERLAKGKKISLEELHSLNSEIGRNTFKRVWDDPTIRAGKEVANSFYHAASDFITSKAKKTKPLFEQLSREYPLNAALRKAGRSAEKAKPFTLRDLMALIAGFSTAGPVGAGVALLGEKALTSPKVGMKAAGILSKPALKGLGNITGLLGIRGISQSAPDISGGIRDLQK